MLGSTKEQRDNRRHLWSGAPDCLVCHRTCPVHQRTQTSNSSPSGNSRGDSFTGLSGVHRTCPVLQGREASGTRQPREFTTAAPLKFTGLSGVHRTVRCNSGATTISAPTATCDALNARAEVRHAHAGAPDNLQFMSGAPPDIKAGPVSELQRSTPNGFGDVVVAPDMSGVHRTVRCAIEQTASPNG